MHTNRLFLSVLACACLATVLLCAAAAPATAARHPCAPSDARMLRDNVDSFVFKLREREINAFGESLRAGHYVCNARVGRWYPMVRSARWSVDQVHLSGDMAAYTMAPHPIQPGGDWPWFLRVINTRTGRFVHNVDFTNKPFVTDFVVSRSGSLAYISYDLRGGDWYYWVKRRTALGVLTLDKGRAIAEFSLERNGASISWKNGGKRVYSILF